MAAMWTHPILGFATATLSITEPISNIVQPKAISDALAAATWSSTRMDGRNIARTPTTSAKCVIEISCGTTTFNR